MCETVQAEAASARRGLTSEVVLVEPSVSSIPCLRIVTNFLRVA